MSRPPRADVMKPIARCRWNNCGDTGHLTLARVNTGECTVIMLLCDTHSGGVSESLGTRVADTRLPKPRGDSDGWGTPDDRGSEINDRYAEGART